MSQISLNSSMRSNLLSLKQTTSLMSIAQERLSTGLKVNSAIDNPNSYYTATSLTNRANDLAQLLDAMGQGIQTIKATSEALETATTLLTQASNVATQAVDSGVIYNGKIAATVTTQAELETAIAEWQSGDGVIVITKDISFAKNTGIKLKNDMQIVGQNYVNGNGKQAKLTFDFDSTTKAIGVDLAKNTLLSDLQIDYTTQVKTNYSDFHAVRNNGYTGVELNNLDIIVRSDDVNEMAATSGIRIAGSGEITLHGTINILAPSENSQKILGIYGGGTTTKIIQAKDSVLNISTSGQNGSGIIYGDNILSGNVNISTSGTAGYGISYGVHNITDSAKVLVKAEKGYAICSTSTNQVVVNYEKGAKIGLYSERTELIKASSGYWTADKVEVLRIMLCGMG